MLLLEPKTRDMFLRFLLIMWLLIAMIILMG